MVMKKRNVFGSVLLTTVMTAVLLAGCGSSGSSSYKSASEDYAAGAAYDADYGVYEEAMEAESYDESSSGSNSAGQVPDIQNRKLITTVTISAETDDMDTSLAAIDKKINELGGYTEKSDIYNGSYSSHVSRNASLTIRIPKDRLNEFIAVIEGGNNITNKKVNVDDVTLSYVDTESRKNSLRTEEQRLLDIMKQAETVEDIITIEDKLASVRYEIESVESQLRSYDNKVDYSTVYLTIDEVKVFTPVEEEGALTRMGNGFMESFHDVVDAIVDFFVWIVVHIPQLILLLILVVIIVIICRIITAASKKSKAKKVAKMQAMYQAQGMQPQQGMPQMRPGMPQPQQGMPQQQPGMQQPQPVAQQPQQGAQQVQSGAQQPPKQEKENGNKE
jgi:hypothetical protein